MQGGRKSYITVALIGLAAAGLALGLCSREFRSSLPGQLLWRLELATYDFRLANSAPNTQSDQIAIVAIDEQSIAQLGVWPWPRRYHARVVENLTRLGAKVIGLDLILSTVSNQEAGEEAAESKPLDWEPPLSEADLSLVKALEASGSVVLAVAFTGSHLQPGELGAELIQPEFPHWRFEEAARAVGIVNVPKDLDGSVRRCRLARSHQDEQFYAMPLTLAALQLGLNPEELASQVSESAGMSGTGSRQDTFLIAYRGKPGRGFAQMPYYQVLRGELSPAQVQQVRGKIVLVGATAGALQDLYDTPLSLGHRAKREHRQGSQMPGVEVIANSLDTILRENYLRPAGFGLVLALACVLTVAVALAEVRLRPLWALPAAWLPAQVAALLVSLVMWESFRLWAPLVSLSLGATLSYAAVTIYLELTTERQRRRLHQSWSQRVSPEVLQVILHTPALTQVKGKRVVATVLFTDLRGFAAFCHESPPEHVVATLSQCLDLITKAVRRNGGTVHKFIGDGVLAVFGDPVPDPDHARRAVGAACGIQEDMALLRKNLGESEWLPYLRVGIHTGELVAGDIGSGELLEYTVIGDTVSTASRLEELNKEYGTGIMISKATEESAGAGFQIRPLGRAQIRGLAEPLEVFAVEPSESPA